MTLPIITTRWSNPFFSLSNAPHHQIRNAILLASHIDLDRDAALRREGHLHQRRHLAAVQGLAVELERVRAGGEGDVGAVEGLEGEGLRDLFGCIYVKIRISMFSK